MFKRQLITQMRILGKRQESAYRGWRKTTDVDEITQGECRLTSKEDVKVGGGGLGGSVG